MSAAQCSRYKKEIDQIVEECEIGKDKVQRLSEMKAKRLVVRKVVQLVRGGLNDTLDTQKAHSLRGLPQYPVGAGLQKYLTINGDYKHWQSSDWGMQGWEIEGPLRLRSVHFAMLVRIWRVTWCLAAEVFRS